MHDILCRSFRHVKKGDFVIFNIILVVVFIDPQNAIAVSTNKDEFSNITCYSSGDCSSVDSSICNENHLCACPELKPIFVNVSSMGYCLETLNLTQGNCSHNEQCNYDHGTCVEKLCVCDEPYTKGKEGTCEPTKKNPLVPIVVGGVIGVSLLGTLVVYFVMSRRKDQMK